MKLKSILLLSTSLLVFQQSMSQSLVRTAGKKYTLVEEATGNWCGYCPDGAQVIEQSIMPVFPHAVVLSWHGYPATHDAMTITNDPYTSASGYISGYPGGSVNRSTSWVGGIQQDRGDWVNDIKADSGTTPKIDLTMKSYYTPADSTIHISITATSLVALTGAYSVAVMILEDSISSTTSDPYYQQHSYLYSTTTCANGQPSWFNGLCLAACPSYTCPVCAILKETDYSHMNVVRAIVADAAPTSANTYNLFGDTIFTSPAINTSNTRNYTYKIPGGAARMVYTKVAAIVGGLDKTKSTTPLATGLPNYYTNRVVENCLMARVRNMKTSSGVLGLGTTSKGIEDISVYPNPAGNNINVQCALNGTSATKVVITNTLGQVVVEKEYPAGESLFSQNITLNNLSNGVYFLKISNNGENATKQFIVGK